MYVGNYPIAPPPAAPEADRVVPRAAPAAAAANVGREARAMLAVAAALVLVKLACLLLDAQPRLFMGDSATYLASAVDGWTPSDRSFTYPLLIRATAGASGSIALLLGVQALLGVATALLLFALLRRTFAVRPWLAAAAAIALAVEPGQLFYERMVMTESASTCALTLTLFAAFAYLRSGRVATLLLCVGAGVLLASLRVGLVPLALALGVAAALLRPRDAAHGTARWAAHVALALLATFGAHDAYKHWYAARAGGEPAYVRDAGIFRLGLVVPLLKPAHFVATGVSPEVLGEVRYPLADARFREYQIWAPDGLIDVLRRHSGERLRAVAAQLAAQAIADDPLGVLRLGVDTELAYFDADTRAQRMWSDLGAGQPPDAGTLTLLRQRFGYDGTGRARVASPVWTYFSLSAPWLIACLFALAPLGIVQAWLAPAAARCARGLLALLCVGVVIGHTLCAHIVSFRYLHPFPLLLLACVAVLLETWLARRAARRAAAGGAA